MSQSFWVTRVRRLSYKYLFFNHIKENAKRKKIEKKICLQRRISTKSFSFFRAFFLFLIFNGQKLIEKEKFLCFFFRNFASKVCRIQNDWGNLPIKKNFSHFLASFSCILISNKKKLLNYSSVWRKVFKEVTLKFCLRYHFWGWSLTVKASPVSRVTQPRASIKWHSK